ncbi:MAG: 4-alpha-glucanotransferase [Eubacteriales bacterium]|nr:4-alpha-glucanotransferase [Eubacteriales bacterium]
MRGSGMLLPVASLPSKYGIGAFSKEAYEFVDLLADAGQKYWQILPLGPTSYGDSPYQSFSTFAGNPYFIDLETLIQEGLLTQAECEACDFGDNPRYIDYGKIYQSRFALLKKAYDRSKFQSRQEYLDFKKQNKDWLKNYGLYMAVKNHFGGVSWNQWDEDIRVRKPEAVEKYEDEFSQEIDFYSYLQYLFQKQWLKLKAYANEKGIQIIGDIPIYVAFDSADTWADPELFQFDEKNEPVAVAGCPPDGFSATGQLWGNPLYRWDYHEQTGFAWWIRRIEHCFKLYDVVRVDHFRGFDEYYAIPYGDKTAEFGKWEQGPGLKLFDTLKEKLGDLPIIAEDLGFLTPSVLKLVKDTGYPGMKVLEFAFDSREESDYLPHTYPRNCVVYTGTHDNQTLKAWYQEMSETDRKFASDYMNLEGRSEEEIQMVFIRAALSSVADTAIIPVQDYLGLGAEARINTPSTLGDNWKWRMCKGEFTEELVKQIRRMTKIYGRL